MSAYNLSHLDSQRVRRVQATVEIGQPLGHLAGQR